MSFASLDFLIFFSVILGGTAILQQHKNPACKQVFLLIASYFFYGYWDWRFCILLLFITVSAYITALLVKSKTALIMGVAIPLVVLGVFKYLNFFLDSFSGLLNKERDSLYIILPVGISFFTFQALSYVIDVKREKIPPEKSFIRMALYISFFPQLVAGPIVKAADFLPQLKEDRKITLYNLETGLQLMVFGLFKKIVLADHLSVFVDEVFGTPAAFNWFTIVLAVISYSLQIYLDFSGYSDIAIGCAKCFGYDFLPNFNIPYISENVTIFWRRWHISLSTWLKEYLYIPLGGNRKGKVRQYVNLMITMLLGGLWHGASWTFVFWGALHGLALSLDKIIPKHNTARKIFKLVNIVGTYAFVTFTWIFFRAENFSKAWQIIDGIFSLQKGIVHPFFWSFISIGVVSTATIIAVVKSKNSSKNEVDGFFPILKLNTVSGLTGFFIACGLLLCLAFTGEQPFVYFQF